MSKKFSVLLVALTIVSGLIGGAISGRIFAPKVAVAEETKQSKILTVEELRIVDKDGKILIKLGERKDIMPGKEEYGLFIYRRKELGAFDELDSAYFSMVNATHPTISMCGDNSFLLASERGVRCFGLRKHDKHKNGKPYEYAYLSVSEDNGAEVGVGIGNKGNTVMSVTERGGKLNITGEGNDANCISMEANNKESSIFARSEDSENGVLIKLSEKNSSFTAMVDGNSASINAGEAGSRLSILGEGNAVSLMTNKYGGSFEALGKSGAALIRTDEYGGCLEIYGKVDNKTRASIGISEHGSGVIGLWDKDGYRLR